MQNHLWCPNDPRGYWTDDDDDDDDDDAEEEEEEEEEEEVFCGQMTSAT